MKKLKIATLFIVTIILCAVMSSCAENSMLPDEVGSNEAETVSTAPTEAETEPESIAEEPEPDEAEEPMDELTAFANEILEELTPVLRTADDILNLHAIGYANDVIEIEMEDGFIRSYYKNVSPYDTIEACMEALHQCFTDELCERIYSRFFDMESEDYTYLFYVTDDGEVYTLGYADGIADHFLMPISGAEQVGEDVIIAKTVKTYYTGENDFEIELKKEDGVWRIDYFYNYDSIYLDKYGSDTRVKDYFSSSNLWAIPTTEKIQPPY